MRLFVAINLTDEIKNSLYGCIKELESCCIKGRFTLKENLHLTIVFIGETDRPQEAIQAMDTVKSPPVELAFGGLGRFARRDGDIYWVGVQKTEPLKRLYRELFDALKEAKFSLQDKDFKPHLTLGRQIVLKHKEITVPDMKMTANYIDLMKSERIDGRLTYTPIYRKKLGLQ